MGALAFNPANAEVTVVTVNMQKLLDGYYKATQATQRLESVQQQAVAEREEKAKELQDMVTQAQAKQEELQNPVLSDDSKAEKEAEIQQMGLQIQQAQQTAQQWWQQKVNDLQQQSQEISRDLINEIVKIVNEIALKDYSADLVLDSSSPVGGVPTVLYGSDQLDITDKVLLQLNADAPTE
jgi:outer membrane protein